MIRICEIDIMFIKCSKTYIGIRKHEFGSGRKPLFTFFEFKGFSTWGERDTIFLCWLLLHRQLSTQPTRDACSAQGRLASLRSESQLTRSEAGTQLAAFFQIPKSSAHASGSWRHSHHLVSFPNWDFHFYISEWHILSARAWTPALMLHQTNPCAKRNFLTLTKPKGKIYKTKSLGNYITQHPVLFCVCLLHSIESFSRYC